MEPKKNLSAIPAGEFAAQQQVLDVDKWLASERARRDLCGTMSWCAYCVKAELYPCAKAKFREEMEKALDDIQEEQEEAAVSESESEDKDTVCADEPCADKTDGQEEVAVSESEPEDKDTICADEPCADETDGQDETAVSESVPEEETAPVADEAEEQEEPTESTDEALEEMVEEDVAEEELAEEKPVPEGYEEVTRLRRSFKSRIIQNTPVQDAYTELKNALLGYAGVKSRVCQGGENFRIGRTKIAKLAVTGKKLSLFLALPPEEFENTHYRFEDVGDKKSHRETPMRLKLAGKRTLKHAKELLQILMSRLGIAEVGCIYSDFHYAYKTDEELIRRGLIKPYTVLVKKKKR